MSITLTDPRQHKSHWWGQMLITGLSPCELLCSPHNGFYKINSIINSQIYFVATRDFCFCKETAALYRIQTRRHCPRTPARCFITSWFDGPEDLRLARVWSFDVDPAGPRAKIRTSPEHQRPGAAGSGRLAQGRLSEGRCQSAGFIHRKVVPAVLPLQRILTYHLFSISTGIRITCFSTCRMRLKKWPYGRRKHFSTRHWIKSWNMRRPRLCLCSGRVIHSRLTIIAGWPLISDKPASRPEWILHYAKVVQKVGGASQLKSSAKNLTWRYDQSISMIGLFKM